MSFRVDSVLKFAIGVCAICVAVMPNSVRAEAAATPAELPVALFAQLPGFANLSLAPDGTRIAYLQPAPESPEGRYQLVVQSLQGARERSFRPPPENLDFGALHWLSNERLAIMMSFPGGFSTKLATVDKDGSDFRFVFSKWVFDQSQVIDWMPDDPDHILMSLYSMENRDHSLGTGIYAVRANLSTGTFKHVEDRIPGIGQWMADQSGEVRYGHGQTRDGTVRAVIQVNGKWTNALDSDWWQQGFRIVAFTENPDVAYVRGPNDRGIRVLRKLDVGSGSFEGTVFEHEKYDVERMLFDSVTGRPVGLLYRDHLAQVQYFDETFAMLHRSLQRAYPEKVIWIVDTSADRRIVVAGVSSATDPGVYYLWNRDTRRMDALGEEMPGLPPDLMSSPRPVSYAARDGTSIPAYLTLPEGRKPQDLPAILLPQRMPKQRDDASFRFLTQFLASRGYAVLQPNFRGSSGYGQSFEAVGEQQWGGLMQDDITDGARWLIEEGIADSQRLCIVGRQYGGYAAAMATVKTPGLFRCAVSINGIFDLPKLSRRYGNSRTLIGLQDRALKTVSPFHHAKEIDTPLLIIHARDASNFADQAEKMFKRLTFLEKPVRLVTVEGGGYRMENIPARTTMLNALEAFLYRQIGD